MPLAHDTDNDLISLLARLPQQWMQQMVAPIRGGFSASELRDCFLLAIVHCKPSEGEDERACRQW